MGHSSGTDLGGVTTSPLKNYLWKELLSTVTTPQRTERHIMWGNPYDELPRMSARGTADLFMQHAPAYFDSPADAMREVRRMVPPPNGLVLPGGW